MAKQIQMRGGSATWNNSFIGGTRELTIDVTGNTIRVHNSVTPGGAAIHYPASAFFGGTMMAVANAAAARTALSLGTVALVNTGTAAGNVVVLGAGPKLPAVDGSNLTGVATAGSLIAIQILTSGTTYTRTPGATTGDIFLIGGPGGGGGCPASGAGTFSAGAGGGAGALTAAINVALPATATIAIGALGAVTSGAAGGAGGTTTFTGGSLTLTAPGGSGGSAVGPAGGSSCSTYTPGGVAGTFIGGTFSNPGNRGVPCVTGFPGGIQSLRGAGGIGVMWGYGTGGNGNAIGASSGAATGAQGSPAAIIVFERS